MAQGATKKVQTDEDVKRKAIKLVISHLKRKVAGEPEQNKAHINEWIENIEKLLGKPEFNLSEYIQIRKELNDVIERTYDEGLRFKLRDSWYSLGKAMERKVKRR